MSTFKSERFFPGATVDVEATAREVSEHFAERSYQVEVLPVSGGAWQVGITRGGMFKAAVGLKSALKIDLEPRSDGLLVRAGAGVFGRQVAPTAITLFVAWPVLLTQVWGMIRDSSLDDEAIRVVELSVARSRRVSKLGDTASGAAVSGSPASVERNTAVQAPVGNASQGREFCPGCGTSVAESARFCRECGASLGAG